MDASTQGNAATTGTATGTNQSSGGDMLDKATSGLLSKSGHGQSGATTEKITDGIRNGFKKMTGKDVPIKDQEMR